MYAKYLPKSRFSCHVCFIQVIQVAYPGKPVSYRLQSHATKHVHQAKPPRLFKANLGSSADVI